LTKETTIAQYKARNAAERSEQEAAFTNVLNDHKARLLRICTAYTTTRSDRDDVFQEIAVQIWCALPDFRGDAALTTWLYRIAVNTALRFAQKERKRSALSMTLQRSGVSWLEDVHTDCSHTEGHHERIEHLHRCIAELSDDGERSVMVLYLEECSYKEIAAITGLSESNIGVKINRCKRKLLQYMTQKGIER
jgi:RNA polymerase sigma-70 factor, ECF subfamily